MIRPAVPPSVALTVAIVGTFLLTRSLANQPAQADEPERMSVEPRLLCKSFETEATQAVDTGDRTAPVGQWISAQTEWILFSVNLEIGQKPTTFQQHWLHVCLSPR